MVSGFDKTVEEVYDLLDSQFEGLSTEEANKRIEKHGQNIVSSEKKVSVIKLFLSQFKNLLVIILLIAGVITGVIGIIESNMEAIIDVSAIAIVVFLNAGLGFYQEYSAEKAISALRKLSESQVIVVRDHKKIYVDSEDVVPGDILFLEAGNLVVADIRVIQSYEIRVSEGILTGESASITKHTNSLPSDTQLADRRNTLFKGTTIVNGSGLGIVVSTGLLTELGKIASSLLSIEQEDTPIQKKLDQLAKQITIGIGILSVMIFLIGIFSIGLDQWAVLLIFSIGLAVAAVPEGLPAVLTLSLALGINRLAKKNALVRKLPAVEVLGSATVICTDKTGTLTRNEQTVRLIWTLDKKYNVTGNGYFSSGNIVAKGTGEKEESLTNSTLLKNIEIGALANEAAIEKQGENDPYKIFGDPTEVALLILAEKGQTMETIQSEWSVEYLFPFDSDRKRMSVIVKNRKTEKYAIMVKGALDILLDLCTNQFSNNTVNPLDPTVKQTIIQNSENYSASYAYRVLGMAFREITDKEAEKLLLSKKSELVERKLTFTGFVGMIDPPRSQSRPAILKAKAAGIRVIMITGDHVETAKAIGRSISLTTSTTPITGKVLDKMTDNELELIVQTTDIFARVNPHHKLRIINALKKLGEIVTMTGDGVNDSPALKRADIGVAMGITGTDVSKEASDMILVDDNFANIIEAVSEGRTIYSNIKKFIGYLLSANAGELITVLFGIIFGLIFFKTTIIPILTIQLLYINLLTDTFPALALGVSPAEEDIMLRKPRDPKEPLIDKEMLISIVTSGLMYGIGTLFGYFWTMGFTLSTDVETVKAAQTMVFVSLVVYQLLHSLSLCQDDLIFTKGFFKNYKLFLAVLFSIIMLVIALYVPFMSRFAHTTPLDGMQWLIILLTALPILIADEVRKFIFNRIRKKNKAIEFEVY